MGDILSQHEIDELLNQLNTGEIDVQEFKKDTHEKKVKEHDFRRPSKFAKDHIRTLQIINENYARLVTNFLSGYLRTLVNFEVISFVTESTSVLGISNFGCSSSRIAEIMRTASG